MSHVLMMPPPSAPAANASPSRNTCFSKGHTRSLKRIPYVTAVDSLEPLPGCTRPFLMRCDDGHLYVVKSATNPCGPRVLVNEYLATRFARELALSVPEIAIVRVPESMGHEPGLHFGSRLNRNRSQSSAHSWLPESVWGLVQNPKDLVGAYIFDTWIGNTDQREVIFTRASGPVPFKLFLIDNSHCFGGNAWRHHAGVTPSPTSLKFAYRWVASWIDLAPWLTRIEGLDPKRVESIVEGVPPQWLAGAERSALGRMVADLMHRRLTVRVQIAAALGRGGHPFSSWRYRSTLFVLPSTRSLRQIA